MFTAEESPTTSMCADSISGFFAASVAGISARTLPNPSRRAGTPYPFSRETIFSATSSSRMDGDGIFAKVSNKTVNSDIAEPPDKMVF